MKLPTLVIKRLFMISGDYRSSEKAKHELARVLEKLTQITTTKALAFANHANRKTIKKKDIKLVLEDF